MRYVISLVMRSIWLSFFISERSEFKLIGNDYAGAALQNGAVRNGRAAAMPIWERTRSGDADVGTIPGSSHWCKKYLGGVRRS